MHSSYAELNPSQREQVDAFLANAKAGPFWGMWNAQEEYLRENVSNLVLTCLSTDDRERWRTKNRRKRFT